MENFRIILSPESDDDLLYQWDVRCRDVNAAREQATAYLIMSGTRYRSAIVLSPWKSQTSWRQAIAPVYNHFNL